MDSGEEISEETGWVNGKLRAWGIYRKDGRPLSEGYTCPASFVVGVDGEGSDVASA